MAYSTDRKRRVDVCANEAGENGMRRDGGRYAKNKSRTIRGARGELLEGG